MCARPSEEGDIGFQQPRKRSSRSLLRAVLLTLFVLLVAILLDGLWVRLPSAAPPAAGERIGAVHIHTQASDGSGTVPEVMAAARQANLSFLAITDHNVAMTAQDIADDPPDLPIISGEELSTSAGHFLALGLPAGWDRPKTPDDRALLAAARAEGAFTVLAHPFHPRTPWTDWKTSDFDGMEIWNEDAVWRQNNIFDLLIALLIYPENDQLAMVRLARTPELNFAKWDELLAQRPVVGMCGSDVHAKTRLGRSFFLRFPGYVPSLEVAREHVLLGPDAGGGDATRASAAEILDALRHGHSFCALGRALSLERIRHPGFQRRRFRRAGRFSFLGGNRTPPHFRARGRQPSLDQGVSRRPGDHRDSRPGPSMSPFPAPDDIAPKFSCGSPA